mmetsp:Transcript_61085/g.145528  ORF Transcript_61085/g.145528 Transcript_61085/m.145528 type:complete len:512 (+) Transcript_61085:75-1610(+)
MKRAKPATTKGMDPFTILQVSPDASYEEIVTAYRSQMLSALSSHSEGQLLPQHEIVWALETIMARSDSVTCQNQAEQVASEEETVRRWPLQPSHRTSLREEGGIYLQACRPQTVKVLQSSMHKALSELQAALQAMPRDERRNRIGDLSRHVRSKLLRFMEDQNSAEACGSPRPGEVAKRAGDHNNDVVESKAKAVLVTARVQYAVVEATKPECAGFYPGKPHTAPRRSIMRQKLANHQVLPPRGVSGISGITVQKKLRSDGTKVDLYKASICFRGLTISSGFTMSIGIAIDRHLLLLRIKHRSLSSPQQELEASVGTAIDATLKEAKLTRDDVGISYRMSISAYHYIGRIVKTHSTRSASEAFCWGRKLQDAARSGWEEFRNAWVDEMSACRQHTYNKVKKRTIAEAQAIADKAWEEAIPYRAKLAERQNALQERRAAVMDQQRKASEEHTLRMKAAAFIRAQRKVEKVVAKEQLLQQRRERASRKALQGHCRRNKKLTLQKRQRLLQVQT